MQKIGVGGAVFLEVRTSGAVYHVFGYLGFSFWDPGILGSKNMYCVLGLWLRNLINSNQSATFHREPATS